MKILGVSNLYPPYYLGGYEIHCAKVLEGLHQRGHTVRVLTSTYGITGTRSKRYREENVNGIYVLRALSQHAFGCTTGLLPWRVARARQEIHSARYFKKLALDFRPDIITWWNMNGLSKLLPPIAKELEIPDVHFVDDRWMIQECGVSGELAGRFWSELWEGRWGPSWTRPLVRIFARRWQRRIMSEGINTENLALDPRHVSFQSRYLQQLHQEHGLVFPSWEVVYGGVDVDKFFAPVRPPKLPVEPLRVLYAGQVSPDRGLHHLVEAWGQLPNRSRDLIYLTVAGDGADAYIASVRQRLTELGLLKRANFLGRVPHERMAEIYRNHEVMVFTSTRPEGQGFTMVEAMLAGCAVVTTGSGGAMEVAAAANLPLIPVNDSVKLCEILSTFIDDRQKVFDVAARGQKVAVRAFNAERMIEKIESTLMAIAKDGRWNKKTTVRDAPVRQNYTPSLL